MNPLIVTLGLALSSFAISPREDVASERVDLIEVNHFYDDQGRLVFDQLLFYDWSQDEERYQLRDWRMLKQQDQLPRLDHERRMWVCHWFDGNALRRVEAESVRETWAQYDPEVTEREFLPKENRRELRKR